VWPSSSIPWDRPEIRTVTPSKPVGPILQNAFAMIHYCLPQLHVKINMHTGTFLRINLVLKDFRLRRAVGRKNGFVALIRASASLR
jgi:hypothetical protein